MQSPSLPPRRQTSGFLPRDFLGGIFHGNPPALLSLSPALFCPILFVVDGGRAEGGSEVGLGGWVDLLQEKEQEVEEQVVDDDKETEEDARAVDKLEVVQVRVARERGGGVVDALEPVDDAFTAVHGRD